MDFNIMDQLASSDQTETIKWRYGTITYFKNDKVIGASLKEYGEWAQEEINFLLHLVHPGDFVLDVGAFIGTHTLAFADKVGIDGKIIAFEPNPRSFELLDFNVRQNQLLNVECHNNALSNVEGYLNGSTFQTVENNPGGNTITTGAVPDITPSDVPPSILTKRLDQYSLAKCRLIKIDVEGMEDKVLEGGLEFIRTHRPIIYAECLSVENGMRIREIMQKESYQPYIHSVKAYSQSNYFENVSNHLFGNAREVSIVFFPLEFLQEHLDEAVKSHNLIPFSNLDDLVLAMMIKPQYKDEVLAKTNTAKIENFNVQELYGGNVKEKYDFLISKVDEFKAELGSQRELVRGMYSMIDDKDQIIHDLSSELTSKEEIIRSLKNQIEIAEKQLQELTRQMGKAVDDHATALEDIEHRHKEELNRKAQAFQTLMTKMVEKSNRIEALESELVQQTNEARKFSQELWEIKHSRSWKVIQKFWAVRLRILPPGSLQIRVLKKVRNAFRVLFKEGPVEFVRQTIKSVTSLKGRKLDQTIQPAAELTGQETTRTVEPVLIVSPDPSSGAAVEELKIIPPQRIDNDNLWGKVRESLKNRNFVLSISHDDYLTVIGGTQMFIADEQQSLEKLGVSYIHLYPTGWLDHFIETDENAIGVNVDSSPIGQFPLEQIETLLTRLADEGFSCLSLNLHHLKGWTFAAVNSIIHHARSQRLIYTVHDFFSICPQYTLLRNDAEYCHVPEVNSHACTICNYGTKRKIHLPLIQELFKAHDFQVIAPSETARAIWLKEYPVYSERISVEPHLVIKQTEIPVTFDQLLPIKIAYIGYPATSKGWNLWREVVDAYNEDTENYKFIHLGRRDEVNPEDFENIRVSANNRDAMLVALRQKKIKVVLHPSICPETFSFVLYEAVAAHCFILTTMQSGNIADYVQKNHNGIVFGSEKDLKNYLADPANLQRDLNHFHELYPNEVTFERNEYIPQLIAKLSMGE